LRDRPQGLSETRTLGPGLPAAIVGALGLVVGAVVMGLAVVALVLLVGIFA
jgi:hypothetical protein